MKYFQFSEFIFYYLLLNLTKHAIISLNLYIFYLSQIKTICEVFWQLEQLFIELTLHNQNSCFWRMLIMRIKLAILEKDVSYLNRIVAVFNQKYSNKIQVYSFTNIEAVYKVLKETKIDVLLVSDYYSFDVSRIPIRCGFAYFIESNDIDTLNNKRTVCKYQKIDLIYKQILSIYSENTENITGIKLTDDNCKVIAFCSPCGGSGVTSVAAGTALRFAAIGKKTLYLNLEKFGSSDILFSSEGQFDFSDIIFALKSKKTNLSINLESCVKRDSRGVFFYSSTKQALDMLELTEDEISRLISELQITGSYDYIIVDIDFNMSEGFVKLLEIFHSIVIIGTGSEISNCKIFRLYSSLVIKENMDNSQLLNRVGLLYNKFSNKTSKTISGIDIKNIGGIPRFDHATDIQVVEQISKIAALDNIE